MGYGARTSILRSARRRSSPRGVRTFASPRCASSEITFTCSSRPTTSAHCRTASEALSISAARQINKAITARGGDRRTGRVISDRFHARPLTSPRAVRNALAYILLNWRHHGEDLAPHTRAWKVDPFSSGATFSGWKELEASSVFWPLPPTYYPLLVFQPRTWLLQNWHRFHALISVREVPGHA